MSKAPIEEYPFDFDENDLSSKNFTDKEYGVTEEVEDSDSVGSDSAHSDDSQKREECHNKDF